MFDWEAPLCDAREVESARAAMLRTGGGRLAGPTRGVQHARAALRAAQRCATSPSRLWRVMGRCPSIGALPFSTSCAMADGWSERPSLIGKCPCLIGKCPCLIGKCPCLIGTIFNQLLRPATAGPARRSPRASTWLKAREPSLWGVLGRACWRRARLPTCHGCASECAGAHHASRKAMVGDGDVSSQRLAPL